jgi:Aldo/keto reductase family
VIGAGGFFALGRRRVHRQGYGAMQLAGDGVFGPPRDRNEALQVLRAAVAAGVDHIDTAQFYGAGTVNELIREALHPYPDRLAIVSKVADEPQKLRRGIEDNLATLGADRLAAVNLRVMDPYETPGPRFDAQLAALIQARDEHLRRPPTRRHRNRRHTSHGRLGQAARSSGDAGLRGQYRRAAAGPRPAGPQRTFLPAITPPIPTPTTAVLDNPTHRGDPGWVTALPGRRPEGEPFAELWQQTGAPRRSPGSQAPDGLSAAHLILELRSADPVEMRRAAGTSESARTQTIAVHGVAFLCVVEYASPFLAADHRGPAVVSAPGQCQRRCRAGGSAQ